MRTALVTAVVIALGGTAQAQLPAQWFVVIRKAPAGWQGVHLLNSSGGGTWTGTTPAGGLTLRYRDVTAGGMRHTDLVLTTSSGVTFGKVADDNLSGVYYVSREYTTPSGQKAMRIEAVQGFPSDAPDPITFNRSHALKMGLGPDTWGSTVSAAPSIVPINVSGWIWP